MFGPGDQPVQPSAAEAEGLWSDNGRFDSLDWWGFIRSNELIIFICFDLIMNDHGDDGTVS